MKTFASAPVCACGTLACVINYTTGRVTCLSCYLRERQAQDALKSDVEQQSTNARHAGHYHKTSPAETDPC